MTKRSRDCRGNGDGDDISSNPKRLKSTTTTLEEILSRLPVKLLCSFKCVRKSLWLLIEDDSESAESITRPGGTAILISTNSEEEGSSLFLGKQLEGCNPETVSWLTTSCHETILIKPVKGLICFINGEECSVRFINLFTREETPLIETTSLTVGVETEKGDKVFARPPIYGFGFDPITKEHKLVRSVTMVVANPFRITVKLSQICDVMTVGDNRWRRIDGAHPPDRILVGDAVHVNGTIYWKSAGPLNGLNPEIDSIVAFDVAKEEFRVIPIPDFILVQLLLSNRQLEGDLPVELLEVDGRVALLGRKDSLMAHMWIFKDFNDKKKINTRDNVILETISLHPDSPWDERKSYCFQALAEGLLILEYYKNEKLARVFSYNRKIMTRKKIKPSEGNQKCQRADYATFIESVFHVQKKRNQSHPPPSPPGN